MLGVFQGLHVLLFSFSPVPPPLARRQALRGERVTAKVGHGPRIPRQWAILGSPLLPAEMDDRKHCLSHAMAFLRSMGPVVGSEEGLGADEATGGKARFTSGYSSRIFIDKGTPDWALIVTIL